jgi:hypothetical protein
LFGRQANVGLKGAFGTITLERQNHMTYLSGLKSDVLGPNLFGTGSVDGYLPNARTDNAIGYLGVLSGVTIGATYSFGRDASAAGGPAATNCAGEEGFVGGSARCGWHRRRVAVVLLRNVRNSRSGRAIRALKGGGVMAPGRHRSFPGRHRTCDSLTKPPILRGCPATFTMQAALGKARAPPQKGMECRNHIGKPALCLQA